MDGQLGENHTGGLHFQGAEQTANRILAEEVLRRGWTGKGFSGPAEEPSRQAGPRGTRAEADHAPDQVDGPAFAAWHGQQRPGEALPVEANPSATSQTNNMPQLEFQTMGDPFLGSVQLELGIRKRDHAPDPDANENASIHGRATAR